MSEVRVEGGELGEGGERGEGGVRGENGDTLFADPSPLSPITHHPSPITPPSPIISKGSLLKHRLAFWGTLVLMVAVDQVVKAWARGSMAEGGGLPGSPPFPGIFEFTLTYNEGIAFGLLQGQGVLLAPVAVAIALGAAWYSLRHPRESSWSHFAMGLLASGAIGNLIDRIAHGRVTDMLWFRPINFPVFNIADSCITVATVMLMFAWLREAGQKPRPSPATETSGESVEC